MGLNFIDWSRVTQRDERCGFSAMALDDAFGIPFESTILDLMFLCQDHSIVRISFGICKAMPGHLPSEINELNYVHLNGSCPVTVDLSSHHLRSRVSEVSTRLNSVQTQGTDSSFFIVGKIPSVCTAPSRLITLVQIEDIFEDAS